MGVIFEADNLTTRTHILKSVNKRTNYLPCPRCRLGDLHALTQSLQQQCKVRAVIMPLSQVKKLNFKEVKKLNTVWVGRGELGHRIKPVSCKNAPWSHVTAGNSVVSTVTFAASPTWPQL